jgi:hypothetical protein
MNDMLIEMLSARAGNNSALADALAKMRSSGGDQLPEDLLARLSTNPTAALLAKHLAESRASSAARETVIDVEPEEVPPKPAAEDCADAMRELRQQVESMFAELSASRERIDLLASALGACCLCWGEEADCRICRGRGRPGFSLPDDALFEQFVLPAVKTLRAQRAQNRSYPPTRTTENYRN